MDETSDPKTPPLDPDFPARFLAWASDPLCFTGEGFRFIEAEVLGRGLEVLRFLEASPEPAATAAHAALLERVFGMVPVGDLPRRTSCIQGMGLDGEKMRRAKNQARLRRAFPGFDLPLP